MSNISRSKANQTIKFGQSIDYDRNTFFSSTKCDGEASLRPCHKKSKLSITLEKQSEMLSVIFNVCPSEGIPKYIKIKVLILSFDLIYGYNTWQYIDISKWKMLIKKILILQFSYCFLVWMFYSRNIKNRVNKKTWKSNEVSLSWQPLL